MKYETRRQPAPRRRRARNVKCKCPWPVSVVKTVLTNSSATQLRTVELGLELHEKRITRDEVYVADEAFFTGTAAEVLPIRELDGRKIGSGVRGPITTELQSRYFDQVKGRREQFPEWLTPVA